MLGCCALAGGVLYGWAGARGGRAAGRQQHRKQQVGGGREKAARGRGNAQRRQQKRTDGHSVSADGSTIASLMSAVSLPWPHAVSTTFSRRAAVSWHSSSAA